MLNELQALIQLSSFVLSKKTNSKLTFSFVIDHQNNNIKS